MSLRGIINGKLDALPRFSDMLTLSQPGGADYAHPLALPHQKMFRDYAPDKDSPGRQLAATCFPTLR